MYPELMRALARLISALSRTPEIDIRKAANAYSYYASKITSGFDYSISYNVGDVVIHVLESKELNFDDITRTKKEDVAE